MVTDGKPDREEERKSNKKEKLLDLKEKKKTSR